MLQLFQIQKCLWFYSSKSYRTSS